MTGRNPYLDIALELERIALEDEYFVSRKLYPNVDFYSGLIYQAMGFPVDMFPVLFAIPRTAGWLAQWDEMLRNRIRKSRGRVRSTSAPTGATTYRRTNGDREGPEGVRTKGIQDMKGLKKHVPVGQPRTRRATYRSPLHNLQAFMSFMYCTRAAELPSSSASPAPAGGQAAKPAAFDSTRAFEHLKQMVAIGPRPAGSAALRQTRAYITRQLSDLGLTVQEQPFQAETPVGRIEMVDLIVRLPGKRTDRILFTGHYDTKLFKEVKFIGASDGASSGAFLIELARVLKDYPREFTHEIVWFDGEEAFCKTWTECGKPDSPDNRTAAAIRPGRRQGERPDVHPRDDALRHDRRERSQDRSRDRLLGPLAHRHRLGAGQQARTREHLPDRGWSHRRRPRPVLQGRSAHHRPHRSQQLSPVAYAGRRLESRLGESLQIVGDVVLASLPEIEKRLTKQ